MNRLSSFFFHTQVTEHNFSEALPLGLIRIPEEIWLLVFQHLEPKNQLSVSLTCRLWRNITQDFFKKYKEQVFDSVIFILTQIQVCTGAPNQLTIASDTEISSLNINAIKTYPSHRSSISFKFNEILNKTFTSFNKSFTKSENFPLIKNLELLEKELSKMPDQLLIFDFPKDLLELPGFSYMVSKMDLVGCNLIYLADRNFVSRIKKGLKNDKIDFINFSKGVLNYPTLINEISEILPLFNRVIILRLFLTTLDDYPHNLELGRINRLSTFIAKLSLSTSHFGLAIQNIGLQNADAIEIAHFIDQYANFFILEIIDENALTDEAFFVICEAINQREEEFILKIRNTHSYLESIKIGLDKLRSSNKVKLTIIST